MNYVTCNHTYCKIRLFDNHTNIYFGNEIQVVCKKFDNSLSLTLYTALLTSNYSAGQILCHFYLSPLSQRKTVYTYDIAQTLRLGRCPGAGALEIGISFRNSSLLTNISCTMVANTSCTFSPLSALHSM